MKFAFSVHSMERMQQRNIRQDIVEQILAEPQQKLVSSDLTIYQSLVQESDKTYLFRIFVNTNVDPNLVVTAYKTSQISKYYESEV